MKRNCSPRHPCSVLAGSLFAHLSNDMIIVGDCATGLLITDKAAAPIRATIDVDVSGSFCMLINRAGYHRATDLKEKAEN